MTEKVKRYLYCELEYWKNSDLLEEGVKKWKLSIPKIEDKYSSEYILIKYTYKYNQEIYKTFDEIHSINSNYSNIEKNIISELYEKIQPITRYEAERRLLYLIINKKCWMIKQQ